jgi:hypothetical protein
MAGFYPSPMDVGVKIPPHVKVAAFCAGFEHGLKGGQLDKVEYMRFSFREGFRASRFFLRDYRRVQGILDFPARWKVRLKAVG